MRSDLHLYPLGTVGGIGANVGSLWANCGHGQDHPSRPSSRSCR
jgi:hypothetical protein